MKYKTLKMNYKTQKMNYMNNKVATGHKKSPASRASKNNVYILNYFNIYCI